MVIKDLNATENFIECLSSTSCTSYTYNKYKSGDILIQILFSLIKTNKEFAHIKTIELQDNSMKKCYGIGIQLKYLRTITDGVPYYAKYNIRPQNKSDYKIFTQNRELHKKNIILKNSIIKDIFNSSKELKNKNSYKIYKKYFEDNLNKNPDINPDINPAIYLRKLIDLENTNLTYKLTNEEKASICELVSYSIKRIYFACGYMDYNIDLWVLKIR